MSESSNILLKLKTAVDHSPVSIIITDLDGNIEFVNRSFTEITQYLPKEVMGKNPRIFKSDYHDNSYYQHMWSLISTGETWRGRFKNLKKNGESYWEDATISPVFDEHKNIINYIAIKEDITDFVEEESENKILKEIIQFNNELDLQHQYAKGFENDFNNILNDLINITELIEMNTNPVNEKLKQYFSLYKQVSKKAENIVSELLFLSSDKQSQKDTVNLTATIIKYINIFCKNRGEITADFDKNITYITNGNNMEIFNILYNLIDNATNALTDKGNIHISLTRADSNHCKLTVKDNGCGIDEDVIKNIFTTDARDYQKKRQYGLRVVKNYMEKYHGRLTISSIPNISTTVELFFPIIQNIETEKEPNTNINVKTILFVDDEEVNRVVGYDSLVILGYKVLLAKDGIEATEIFNNNQDEIDLVIMDMIMPNLDGFNTFLHLKKIRNDIKVIICSAYLDYVKTQDLIDGGVLAILSKPFSIHELEHVISSFI